MGGMAKEESNSDKTNGVRDNNFKSSDPLDGVSSLSTTNFNNTANMNLLDKADTYSKPLSTNAPVNGLSSYNEKNKTSTNMHSTPNYLGDESSFETVEAPEIDQAAALKKKNDLHAKQQAKLQKEKDKIAAQEKRAHYKALDRQKQAHTAEATAIKIPPAKPISSTAEPDKPTSKSLVSDAAKADNENIKNTVVNKSGEINGLPPIIDEMMKEDSLGGKAVTEDLIGRIKKEDPETARKLVFPVEAYWTKV